jgi:hypothetical protein
MNKALQNKLVAHESKTKEYQAMMEKKLALLIHTIKKMEAENAETIEMREKNHKDEKE